MEAGHQIKQLGNSNNLLDLIAQDEYFGFTKDELQSIVDPKKYIGRSVNQVEELIEEVINPLLEEHKDLLGAMVDLKV